MSKLLKLSLVMVFFCVGLFVYAYAADVLRPTGYEAVAVDNNVGGRGFTEAKYWDSTNNRIKSDYAVIINETAPIRFTVDGTAPTSTVGALLVPSQAWVFETYEEVKAFRAIRTGDVSASLKVLFYKRFKQ